MPPVPPRAAAPNLIHVTVEGIGAFTFRRRTLGDEITILTRYHELVPAGIVASAYLDEAAIALAEYRTLAATWPEGWAPDVVAQADVLEAETDRLSQLLEVWRAFARREDEFRPATRKRLAPPRPPGGADAGDVVPPEIQPPANGPALPPGDG